MELTVIEGCRRRTVRADEGESLLEVLRRAGAMADAPCGGRGTCGKCRVLVRDCRETAFKLACATLAEPSMEVTVEGMRPVAVSTSGLKSRWIPDCADGPGAVTLAFDMGTTTVVCRLTDSKSGRPLASVGRSNPQLAFGADVISRITAAEEGHLKAMEELMGDCLASLAAEALALAGRTERDVTRAVAAGNTVMETIAAGLDPSPIGIMPFTPPSLFGDDRPLLAGLPPVRFAPCAAGYVGGDVLCDLLALDVLGSNEPLLLLDLGTNGEMALGDKTGVLACATAAGPVFEGASIRFGMPAYPGAIRRVAQSNGGLEVETVGGRDPAGICGTGLIDAVALMLDGGVVDETGRLLGADEVPGPLSSCIGFWEGEPAFFLTEGICVTQKDVRCLQLAKSAVCAGILTLLEERGLKLADVGRLAVAGGFGEYLDLGHAARVGLFPADLLDRAMGIGNGAIEGAAAWTVSSKARFELERIAACCEYLELSVHSEFNGLYVETMMFPEEDGLWG